MEIKTTFNFSSNCQKSTVLSDVVVVLLLRLLIKLNWSWWWETTGQGREFGAGAGGGPWAESVSSEPRGRHRHKQQHPESHELQDLFCFSRKQSLLTFQWHVISVCTSMLFRMLSHWKALQIVNVISLINLWKRPICVKTEEWVGSIKRIWGDTLVVLLVFDSTEWIVFVDFLFLKMLLGWHFPN